MLNRARRLLAEARNEVLRDNVLRGDRPAASHGNVLDAIEEAIEAIDFRRRLDREYRTRIVRP